MLNIWLFLALVATSAAQQQQQQQRPNYTHHAVLDPEGKFLVHWLPGASENDYITFECEVATQGWLGLGFSSNGAMAAADIVIAWIDQSGKPQISDRHGPAQGNGYPPPDDIQNYELINGRKNRTHTVVTFRRKQDTCDTNDWKITSDTTRMIWAYNDQLPSSINDIPKHSMRGVHSVQLINPQTKDGMNKILADPNTQVFDLRVANVKLPNDKRTLYWCEIIELPKRNKQHIIANKMMVQKGNERYVHHLIAYSCGETDMSEYLGKPSACFDDTQTFNPMKQCTAFFAVWAVGGEDFAYPNNMGAPIFEDKQRFVLLEIHYDNPDLTPGVTDNSAFRLYVTDKLRPVETGRFTIGMPVSPVLLVIPPKQKRFTTYVYCSSECTSKLTQPMNVFTGLLHTHLLGVAMKLRVIRKGTEIKSEMKDDHYDFNYQTPVFLSKPLVLQPGDDLIVECTYDSTNRDKISYGGYGSDQEMCIALLEYYPKRNKTTESCSTLIDPIEMLQILGAKKNEINLLPDDVDGHRITIINQNKQNVTVVDWYNKDVEYTDAKISKLQDFMKNSPQTGICGLEGKVPEGKQSNDTAADISFKVNSSIPVTSPYIETNSICGNANNNNVRQNEPNQQMNSNNRG